jgi:hypothetical protein
LKTQTTTTTQTHTKSTEVRKKLKPDNPISQFAPDVIAQLLTTTMHHAHAQSQGPVLVDVFLGCSRTVATHKPKI